MVLLTNGEQWSTSSPCSLVAIMGLSSWTNNRVFSNKFDCPIGVAHKAWAKVIE